MKNVDVLMVGVGGHGVIMASDAMAEIGMNNGYDVKKSDTLGLAQRGGSVTSHVRWGKHVFSPIIKKGNVDFILGFEQLEAARWASYLKPGGLAIIADVVVVPVAAVDSRVPYPSWDEITQIFKPYTDTVYMAHAAQIGREVNNPRAMNMAMLGFLSAFLELSSEGWTDTMRRRLPPKFVESSVQAFIKGADEAKALLSTNGGVK
ncbi:MAG: indolepyruvate oxidoreductase subunit beta [Chloroflexota bacterium]|nr:indolepyruvate oxidoreductase subunit beta [Chloroflexota bacterium]